MRNTPGEDIRDVVDSVIFASSRIGSVIPMLFTPVPGSALYEEYQGFYLMRWALTCST